MRTGLKEKGNEMTKAQIVKAAKESLERAKQVSEDRIASMREQAHNPQVALMIEKNKGYVMAMEDALDVLRGARIIA